VSDAIVIAIIAGLPGFLLGGMSLIAARGKTSADIEKTRAESENIHAQIADRWAEQAAVLQDQVKSLMLDVAQVRRENEKYRAELVERDMAIADLKDWAARLIRQLAVHAPGVVPEKYCHVVDLENKNDTTNLYRSERGGAERPLET